jgi:hypothetical protein
MIPEGRAGQGTDDLLGNATLTRPGDRAIGVHAARALQLIEQALVACFMLCAPTASKMMPT